MGMIQDKLILWGRGLAMDTPPNGYPPMSPYAREMRNPGQASVKLPPLPEDEQERIDIAVSDMKITKPDHYEVICYAYITRLTDSRIARKVKRSRTWCRETRLSAEHYLEGKLY